MHLIRGLYNCPESLFHKGCVATIGNFDGVHIGHQAIVSRLTCKAKELGLPSVVVLFEPHPQEFFRPQESPARLFKLTDKVRALDELGVNFVLCFRFNQQFAELTAKDFVTKILIDRLRVKHLFIGDDFRFGHQRQGDFELLKSYQFAVEANHSVTLSLNGRDLRISSSSVRQALIESDFAWAATMLGKPYQVRGKVVHGDKQGRQIGVPTANLALKRRKNPLHGVYAVKVYGLGEHPINGVANVGVKPTLNLRAERLEVHLLDFAKDIYGKQIAVEPVVKIRNEKKFASVDELKLQIAHDVEQAKQIFKNINEK